MQITSDPNSIAVTDLTAGMIISERVQLAGDLEPTLHRLAIVKVTSDAVHQLITLNALVDGRDSEITVGYGTDEQVTLVRRPFKPGYEVSDARIWSSTLRPSRTDGTATVTFLGDVADATRCWTDGQDLRLFAEVTPTEDTATEIRVAVVPTGKRAPLAHDGSAALRLGGAGGSHVYLLAVDGTVDRAAYETARTAREAARAASRMLRSGGFGCDE